MHWVDLLMNLLPALSIILCATPLFIRTLHMYQLSSYQNPAYRRWLRENRRALWGASYAAGITFCFGLGIFFHKWLLILAGVACAYLHRYPASKKPLAYTARVKRLLVTYGLCSAAVCAVICWLYYTGAGQDEAGVLTIYFYKSALAAVLAVALILLQPWLVMLYAAINSPVEKAINRRYIREARDILRGHPGLMCIGITGSYGKTSVKHFLEQLLSVKYNVYITPGNYNTTLGVVRAVREGLRPTHEIFLCEMGARHPGDIAEICDLVQPQTGVLTYIGSQHLESFGSQQAITDTKLELARAVEARGGHMFVNWGSPVAAAQTYRSGLTRYGAAREADYRAEDVAVTATGSAFTITAPGGESARFSTRLLGLANIENITGAVAVAHSMGLPLARLVPAVRALKGVPHRLELKPAGDMTLIDDAYNSNPMGAKNALETLALCPGSRIVLTPGLVELGPEEAAENRALGARAAACAHHVVVVGQSPGDYVAQGALEAGLDPERLYRARDVEEALRHARALPLPDKFVLLLNDLPDNYS